MQDVLIDNKIIGSIDIYDNAMFLIALDNLIEMLPETKGKWEPIRKQIANNTRKHLWDVNNQKFIPHIYLDGSPFPEEFKENEIFYHGGTAVAIEAGLLSKEEIKISLDKMISNMRESGAGSIGLTMYPPYPDGYYKNKSMYPYGYQNGGDWTWFGGRMIQQLVIYGFVEEAYEQLQPMVKRVKDNDGFFEWYTVDNKPNGSILIKGLKNEINRIWVVGNGTKLDWKIMMKQYWSEVPGLLYIDVPEIVLDEQVTVIAVLLNGPAEVYRKDGQVIESN